MLIDALRAAVEGDDAPVGLEELVSVRRLIDRVEAKWLATLDVVVQCGDCETATGLGGAEWLADACGRTVREAKGTVRLARRLAVAPVVAEALGSGELSLAQAVSLTSGASKRTLDVFATCERSLVRSAKTLSADQLALVMRQWCRRADAETASFDERDVDTRRAVFVSPVGDLEWALNGTLTAEQGCVVSEAIGAVVQADWERSAETRTLCQRRADALSMICRRWLDSNQSVVVHGERPHLTVSVSLTDLVEGGGGGGRGGGGGVTSAGSVLDDATVQRLACDCKLTRVVRAGSVVLDVGRATVEIPLALRRAVIARDVHCRFAGCTRPAAWSEVHHVVPQHVGGAHRLGNLVLLCGRHHHLVHRLGWKVVLHDDATLDVNDGNSTRSSRPPPDAQIFVETPRCPRASVQLECERSAVVGAMAVLRAASSWTDDDHNQVDLARGRFDRLVERADRAG